MASLDYAFLADYAKVANGTLTSVGASWTFLTAPQIPTQHRMAIAGRVRAGVGETAIPFRVQISGPENTFRIELDGLLNPDEGARPYGEGILGFLFALDVQVPIPAAGLYEVHIFIDGEFARRLAFDVVTPDGAPPST